MKTLGNSIVIAVGLLLLGCTISLGLFNLKPNTRSVFVKGLCEIEMPADRVIWPIAYSEVGNDLQTIYSNMESKNKIVMQFLIENGITKDEFSISAPSVVDKIADQYSSNYEGQKYGARYVATQVFTVSSSKVEKIRELMVKQAVLLKNNIATVTSWQYQIQYLFTELDSVKPAMVEQATKNARITAEKFAQDSKSELGKIIMASQGQLTIEDRDQNSPYIKKLRIVTSIQYSLED